MGSFALQIAKAFGARVTGVCSTGQIDRVIASGADEAIDYTREDFTQIGRRWDVIIETAGARPISELRRALTEKGTFVLVGGEGGGRWVGKAGRMVEAPMISPFISQNLRTLTVKHNGDDLVVLKDLIEAGKVTPVVGSTYSLQEVPRAMRDLIEGRLQGKTVIAVKPAAASGEERTS